MYIVTGKVRLEFHHLAFIGPESLAASEAAECAAEQGAFWAYHDMLFTHQAGENRGAFNNLRLKSFAEQIGLDTEQFNACLDSERYREEVIAETQAAQTRGVRATPTFFINGQKIEGALPFEQFQSIIEEALGQ